jgi:hypothetical protein
MVSYFNMLTINELHKNIVAIYLKSIKYDYFGRTVEMLITPNYGVKEDFIGRKFKLLFNDCVGTLFVNTSLWANKGQETEFIAWGERSDHSEVKKMLDAFSSRMPFKDLSEDIILNRKEVKELKGYSYYFFENVLGDGIELIASESKVEEVFNI